MPSTCFPVDIGYHGERDEILVSVLPSCLDDREDGIRNGVFFQLKNLQWVMEYEDLEQIYLAAKRTREDMA